MWLYSKLCQITFSVLQEARVVNFSTTLDNFDLTKYVNWLKNEYGARATISYNLKSANLSIQNGHLFVTGEIIISMPKHIAKLELKKQKKHSSNIRPNINGTIWLNNNGPVFPPAGEFGTLDTTSNSDDYPKSPKSKSRYRRKHKTNLLKLCLTKNLKNLSDR